MPTDTSAVQAALRDYGLQAMDTLAERFIERVQSRMSRRTGQTAESVQSDGSVDEGTRITNRVFVGEESARYQDEGTGIYGPEGHRIEGSPLLAFDWPAAGGLVIVHSVAGAPGTHFWTYALEDWPEIVASL